MKEIVYQEKNPSLPELFIARQDKGIFHFSVKKEQNGEIFLGQYDSKDCLIMVWRADRHIKKHNERYYLGVSEKMLSRVQSVKAIEFEMSEGKFVVPISALNDTNTLRFKSDSFLNEVLIDLETIFFYDQPFLCAS